MNSAASFTCHGLRKATLYESECVRAYEMWSDLPSRLFEVVIDIAGCDHRCQHLDSALDAIGPWASLAVPDRETQDGVTGTVTLLLAEPASALIGS